MNTDTTLIDLGLGGNTSRALGNNSSDEIQGASTMTPFIFPAAVALFLFGGWIMLTSYEPCLLDQTDPKFDCWGSLLFTATFASIGSGLTGLIALLARVVLHPLLWFETQKMEWTSALVASLLLLGLSYSVIHWGINVGHIGVQLFSWLGVSFVVCGISLMIVKCVAMRGAP